MESVLINKIKFEAMGTDVEIIIDGDKKLLNTAKKRLDILENKWSRFLPSSEISILNNSQGDKAEISNDTALLIRRAIESYQLSEGLYDPTILGDLLKAGYSKSFEKIKNDKFNYGMNSDLHSGTDQIVFNTSNTVTLGKGVGFDPGGIGKGLASDLIANEIIDLGANSILINIGGDIRTLSSSNVSADFEISIYDENKNVLDIVSFSNGAIATSTTKKRKWNKSIIDSDGTAKTISENHIIDPRTKHSSNSNVDLVSVISSEAWRSEILCKEVMLNSHENKFHLIEQLDAAALIRLTNGTIYTSKNWSIFSKGENA